MNKEYRIKKNREIEALLKQNTRVANQHFALYYLHKPEAEHFRFAISVSRKWGTAVARNKIKRQLREIVRKKSLTAKVDFFIVVKTALKGSDYKDIDRSLTNLFARAKIIEGQDI